MCAAGFNLGTTLLCLFLLTWISSCCVSSRPAFCLSSHAAYTDQQARFTDKYLQLYLSFWLPSLPLVLGQEVSENSIGLICHQHSWLIWGGRSAHQDLVQWLAGKNAQTQLCDKETRASCKVRNTCLKNKTRTWCMLQKCQGCKRPKHGNVLSERKLRRTTQCSLALDWILSHRMGNPLKDIIRSTCKIGTWTVDKIKYFICVNLLPM